MHELWLVWQNGRETYQRQGSAVELEHQAIRMTGQPIAVEAMMVAGIRALVVCHEEDETPVFSVILPTTIR